MGTAAFPIAGVPLSPIVHISGNHEFYRGHMQDLMEDLLAQGKRFGADYGRAIFGDEPAGKRLRRRRRCSKPLIILTINVTRVPCGSSVGILNLGCQSECKLSSELSSSVEAPWVRR
jgi:hypothetical protein